jgi:hypothetical protein
MRVLTEMLDDGVVEVEVVWFAGVREAGAAAARISSRPWCFRFREVVQDEDSGTTV